jgi:hypothetical protein
MTRRVRRGSDANDLRSARDVRRIRERTAKGSGWSTEGERTATGLAASSFFGDGRSRGDPGVSKREGRRGMRERRNGRSRGFYRLVDSAS